MTRQKIKEVICKELKLDAGHFDGKEDKLFQEVGMDSLDLVELCLLMEDEFNIRIDPHKNKFKTLNDVYEYLKAHGLED